MTERVHADKPSNKVVQADPEELAVFARALLDGEDSLRRDVNELNHLLDGLYRGMAASGTRARLPNPIPDILACLDDRVTLSSQITRLADAFDQVDMHMAELDS